MQAGRGLAGDSIYKINATGNAAMAEIWTDNLCLVQPCQRASSAADMAYLCNGYLRKLRFQPSIALDKRLRRTHTRRTRVMSLKNENVSFSRVCIVTHETYVTSVTSVTDVTKSPCCLYLAGIRTLLFISQWLAYYESVVVAAPTDDAGMGAYPHKCSLPGAIVPVATNDADMAI